MIRRTGHRSAILLAGISALAPVWVQAQTAPLQSVSAAARFSPSDKPMVLTRTVRRQLPGGKEIVATRNYAVQIQPYQGGFVVDGHLIDSQIEAPPMLAALAELERSRPDSGLFPIMLDNQGIISSLTDPLATAGTTGTAPARLKAAELTGAAVSQAVANPEARIQATSFVRHVRDHGAGSTWPEDLFHPRSGTVRSTHPVDTGGGAGTVAVLIEADAAIDNGLMKHFRRTVTTELGDSTRTSSEEWMLVPAG